MVRVSRLVFVLAAAASAAGAARGADGATAPVDLVNPLIGTANGGNVFPGAVAPFGMAQFSPEESPDPAKKRPIASPGGYAYKLDHIRGFSLTNVSGWGCAGGSGDVPLMPVTTPVTVSPSSDFRTAYAVRFSHADERARAGEYQVTLGNGVKVDLTVSPRTASGRFAFPASTPANLLVRASDSEVGSQDAHLRIDPVHRTVSGDVTSGNFCGYLDKADRRSYYTLHFVAQFDRPVQSHGVWRDGTVEAGGETTSGGTSYGDDGFPPAGRGSGGWVGFAPGAVVNVRIGLSYVSEANARANLQAENPAGSSFESIRDETRADWNRRLGQIEAKGGTDAQRTVFYTALYHAMIDPALFSDVDGEYFGLDGKTHRLEGGQRAQYANFSGWDVYRSQFQLLAWLDPHLASDIAQSLINQARQNGGAFDRWTHESGATHVMNGDPAAPAIADIWAFGGRDFDARGALDLLVRAADAPTPADLSHDGCPVVCVGERPGLDQALKLHFIPTGAPGWGPAADTLEDATADFAVSTLADRLGDGATSARFLRRSAWWRNLYNPKATPEGGYIQNRNPDGTWAEVKDDDDKAPHAFTPSTEDGFVEGTAAIYVWMVPFDVRGLFDAMGGAQTAAKRLDGFFYRPDGAMAVTDAGPLHAELNNEPSVGTPWLYDYAGEPWKTQELVRGVLDTLWVDAPQGIPGNDDLGEMSAWAVWAALGLYPETPGRAELVLGSPLFASIVVHRPAGDLRIDAEGGGPGRPYVQGLTLDGRTWSQPWLPERVAATGGRLEFRLGAKPSMAWGSDPALQPPSFSTQRPDAAR